MVVLEGGHRTKDASERRIVVVWLVHLFVLEIIEDRGFESLLIFVGDHESP